MWFTQFLVLKFQSDLTGTFWIQLNKFNCQFLTRNIVPLQHLAFQFNSRISLVTLFSPHLAFQDTYKLSIWFPYCWLCCYLLKNIVSIYTKCHFLYSFVDQTSRTESVKRLLQETNPFPQIEKQMSRNVLLQNVYHIIQDYNNNNYSKNLSPLNCHTQWKNNFLSKNIFFYVI